MAKQLVTEQQPDYALQALVVQQQQVLVMQQAMAEQAQYYEAQLRAVLQKQLDRDYMQHFNADDIRQAVSKLGAGESLQVELYQGFEVKRTHQVVTKELLIVVCILVAIVFLSGVLA